MKLQLEINYIYIEDKEKYKIRSLLKNKGLKYIIDYNSFLGKDNEFLNSKLLIGSLILKKIKKIISKRESDNVKIFYVLSEYDTSKVINLNSLIKKYFTVKITNNLFTDYSGKIHKSIFDNIHAIELVEEK